MTRPAILVTGAGGFIGGWMAEGLSGAGAAEVRAGVRDPGRAARLAALPVKIVECDIMREGSLDAAMAGVEVVVHCALSHADSNSLVAGTRLVLDRARANGVRKVIYLSSIAVYGAALGNVSEETAAVAPVNRYGERKRAAEAACREAAGSDLAVAVLRPSLVYGPFGKEWTALYIERLAAGRLARLGPAGDGRANLIYAGDLVEFAAHLARTEIPPFSICNANGPEIPTFNEYFDQLSRGLGRGPLVAVQSGGRTHPVRKIWRYALNNHGALLAKAARPSRAAGRFLRQAEADMRLQPSAGEIRLYGRDVVYSTLRARQLGFEAATSLTDGIAASATWARASGLIR